MDGPLVALVFSMLIASVLSVPPPRSLLQRQRDHSSGGPKPNWLSSLLYPSAQWITQRLDHFNKTDQRTWQQRYWVRESMYSSGGPAFLLIEGEEIGRAENLYGYQEERYAQRVNAMMFQLEHRFYGQSIPTDNISRESLQYLSIDQALSDAAHFIKSMNKEHEFPEGTKWIVFGGSYAGCLAAWMRYKYPDLVYGAVASSAPIFLKVEFPEYFESVEETLSSYGETCVEELKPAIWELNNDTQELREEEEVIDVFGTLLSDENEVNHVLKYKVANNIHAIIQYNKYETKYGMWSHALVCDVIVHKDKRTLKERTSIIHHLTGFSSNSDDSIMQPWTYQTCSEFGLFPISRGGDTFYDDLFPLQAFVDDCAEQFGEKFTEEYIRTRVDTTARKYRGVINTSRIVYVHGGFDPWRKVGLLETKNYESPVIFIEEMSHCQDDLAEKEHDSTELKNARKHISDIIAMWVKN